MKQTINKSMFHDAFRNYDRLENFSYEGREALYDSLIECEESSGEEMELDVIALCCEYSEEKIGDALKNYNLESLEELTEQTCVIWNDGERVLFVNY
jgi:hypothetical protein